MALNITSTFADLGTGIGGLLTALASPLGDFMLNLGIVGAILGLVGAIIVVIKRKMTKI